MAINLVWVQLETRNTKVIRLISTFIAHNLADLSGKDIYFQKRSNFTQQYERKSLS